MIGTRHEEYRNRKEALPFVIYDDITRTPFNYSKEKNWHEDIEIQLCTKGSGSVLFNGKQYEFKENNIAIAESNVIHYTFSNESLTYSCIIISPEFCRNVGIDLQNLRFLPIISDESLVAMIKELIEIYNDKKIKLRIAKLNELILKILISLVENHSSLQEYVETDNASFKRIKNAIKYIRKNYNSKITLDNLAKEILTDKYTLCREFKRYSGKTVTQYVNSYRSIMAADYISQGYSVSEAARNCGFENLSFFTKTFKRYMGELPSHYNKMIKQECVKTD